MGIKFSDVDLDILDTVDDVAEYWKDKSEFIFKICMAILLLISFHPLRTATQTVLTKETKLLIYLFGFIIIVTSEWKKFFADISFFDKYFDK